MVPFPAWLTVALAFFACSSGSGSSGSVSGCGGPIGDSDRPPEVETLAASDVDAGAVTLHGRVIPGTNLPVSGGFEWSGDPDFSRPWDATWLTLRPGTGALVLEGASWSDPASRDFAGRLSGLAPGTTYFHRAVAVDPHLRGEGQVRSFTTAAAQPPSWARTFGGPPPGTAFADGCTGQGLMPGYPDDAVGGLAALPDGGFAVAGTTGSLRPDDVTTDAWVLRFDAAGDLAWTRQVHDPGCAREFEQALAVAPLPGGGLVLAANLHHLVEAPARFAWSSRLVALDASGAVAWQSSYGAFLVSVHAGPGGLAAAAGDGAVLRLDSDGALRWARSFDGRTDPQAIVTADGGVALLATSTAAGGSRASWIAALSPEGLVRWQRQVSSGGDAPAHAIAPAADGGVILAGSSPGDPRRAWVARLDPAGAPAWERTLAIDGEAAASSVAPLRDGGFVVGATLGAAGATPSDLWVVVLSDAGEVRWQRRYGRQPLKGTVRVAETADGRIVAAAAVPGMGSDVQVLLLGLGQQAGLLGEATAAVAEVSSHGFTSPTVPLAPLSLAREGGAAVSERGPVTVLQQSP